MPVQLVNPDRLTSPPTSIFSNPIFPDLVFLLKRCSDVLLYNFGHYPGDLAQTSLKKTHGAVQRSYREFMLLCAALVPFNTSEMSDVYLHTQL